MTKEVALGEAKRRYINNSPNLIAHPFFWAAMVIWGDVDSIC